MTRNTTDTADEAVETITASETKYRIEAYRDVALERIGCSEFGRDAPSVSHLPVERSLPVAGIGSNHHDTANDASHDLVDLSNASNIESNAWATLSYPRGPSQPGGQTLVWEQPPTVREITLAETLIENAQRKRNRVTGETLLRNLYGKLYRLWGDEIRLSAFKQPVETKDAWLPGEHLTPAVGPNSIGTPWHDAPCVTGVVEYTGDEYDTDSERSERVQPTLFDDDPVVDEFEHAWIISGFTEWVFARTDDGVEVYTQSSVEVEDVTVDRDGNVEVCINNDGDVVRGGFKSVCIPEGVRPERVVECSSPGVEAVFDTCDVEQQLTIEV